MNYRVCVLLFLISYTSFITTIPSAISYELNGGRFGDNVRSFTQAYWESYRQNVPLLYVPFPGSEQLQLHTQFEQLSTMVQERYKTQKKIDEDQWLVVENPEDSLYIATYFCRNKIDWHDQQFMQKLRFLFSPREPVMIPEGIEEAIALHVRRGGGFHNDTMPAMRAGPTHFPSLSYYARSLDHLMQELAGHRVVYIYTDDPNPRDIAQQIFNQLEPDTAARIEIRFRGHGNAHDRNIIEDFMALRAARYLIRPNSNFSEYAELFGHHTCVVMPARHRVTTSFGIIETAVFLYKDRPAKLVMLL